MNNYIIIEQFNTELFKNFVCFLYSNKLNNFACKCLVISIY